MKRPSFLYPSSMFLGLMDSQKVLFPRKECMREDSLLGIADRIRIGLP